MTNVAYILSLIAPLFSYLKEEDYVSMQQNPAWQDVRAAAGAPLQEALLASDMVRLARRSE